MLLLLSLLTVNADAMPRLGSGRPAVGVQGAIGVAPTLPGWPEARNVELSGCTGAVGWWIYGGYTHAGPKGQVKRADDTWRVGGAGGVCAIGGGQAGNLGFALGRQWGGHLYFTAHTSAGVSVYALQGPRDSTLTTWAPYVSPNFALGLSLMPGFTVEVGPYVLFAPPLVQAVRGMSAEGLYLGHGGLQATILFGNASPSAFGK